MTEFIPHQLGLSNPQMRKLMLGHAVNIPHAKMGSGAGETVISLHPENAKRLLSAYKRGRGLRLKMNDHELQHTMKHGSGFFDKAKKMATKAYHAVGKAVGTALTSPQVKELAKQGAEMGAQEAGKAIAKATGNQEIGHQVASTLAHSAKASIENKGSVQVGLDTAKQDIKGHAVEHLNKAVDKHIPDDYKTIARQAIHAGVSGLDSHPAIIAHEEVHPPAPEVEPQSETDEEDSGLSKLFGGQGLRGGKINFKKIGKVAKTVMKNPLVKSVMRYGAPIAGATIGDILGGPAGAMVGEQLGQMGATAMGAGMMKRGRGRPRKLGGNIADTSAMFKKTLRLNYGGLKLNNQETGPAPKATNTNPKVKPSSDAMTLSPYQKMSSPAMNPFIPMKYSQQGGTSCGYGGKGLYGSGLYGP